MNSIRFSVEFPVFSLISSSYFRLTVGPGSVSVQIVLGKDFCDLVYHLFFRILRVRSINGNKDSESKRNVSCNFTGAARDHNYHTDSKILR